MPREYESKRNLEEFSDADICVAIRYLDPDSHGATNREDAGAPVLICVTSLVLLLGCVALIWLFCRGLG